MGAEMTEEDTWSISISALQHFLYCPRQCGLIHLEQIWTENTLTAQGRVLHQQADQPRTGLRHGLRTVTAMPLSHPELGIHGVADVVEFAGRDPGSPAMPVEYKRGRPKLHRADEVQLCAQALCLERMLHQHIETGALFYGEPRRRQEVIFDGELRALTEKTIHSVRAMLESGRTPSAEYEAARCDRCSLLSDCRPHSMGRPGTVSSWLQAQLKE